MGPEGMGGAGVAGGAGAASRGVLCGQAVVAGAGVQGVRAGVRAAALSDRARRPALGVSAAVVEPLPTDLLPPGRCAAVLTARLLKSASGCADPPPRRTRPR